MEAKSGPHLRRGKLPPDRSNPFLPSPTSPRPPDGSHADKAGNATHSARVPPTLLPQEVRLLCRWLQVQVEHFNKQYAVRDDAMPVGQFLMLAAQQGKRIYHHAFHELIRQVTVVCADRGALMADIWLGYAGMVDTILQGMEQQHQQCNQTLDTIAREAAHASTSMLDQVNRLEAEVAALKAQQDSGYGARNHRLGPIAVPDLPSTEAEQESGDVEGQNRQLKDALEDCRKELFEVYEQIASLEKEAEMLVALESRAETAENERDDAREKLRCCTPRPGLDLTKLSRIFGADGAAWLEECIDTHRQWPAATLAGLLMGETSPKTGKSVLEIAPDAFGCLASAVNQGHSSLKRSAVQQALNKGCVMPFADFCTAGQLEFIQGYLLERPPGSAPDAPAPGRHLLLDFLLGSTEGGYTLINSREHYGSMLRFQWGSFGDVAQLTKVIEAAKTPTSSRVADLEAENRQLLEQVAAFRAAAEAEAARVARRQAMRQRHEHEAQAEKKHPVEAYIELLASGNEAMFKESLVGMGSASEVPRLFRCNGKVRNKHISKRETEKLIKEVWREKAEDMRTTQTDLAEFVFTYLQKKVGIVTAVVEMGYNLLYGLWKYKFDADCELFLKILKGEVKEDVYLSQVQLQDELQELFLNLDKSDGGQGSGSVSKATLRLALEAFFRVGLPGGKTKDHFDELMQALDEDQPADKVEHAKIFEEDREYNQGAFAEAVRDQFLQERITYFKELEVAIYGEAAHEEECTREHVKNALVVLDGDLSERRARSLADEVFMPGVETSSVKVVMKRLQKTAVKRGRHSSVKMSVVGRLRGAAAGKSTHKGPSEAVVRALDAVRVQWLGKAHSSKPAHPHVEGTDGAAGGKEHLEQKQVGWAAVRAHISASPGGLTEVLDV
ncbi:hypothetical protein WJX72_011489 [[Myrmecia] bisecta]|uniref:Translin-associated factor X-interacting protein 1 N-terminal domain-containing protein n=1 Tax=[Myrmecia] bisecta TaxID=41462 RepID=A0AAW1QU31_9CHLO